MPSRRTSLSELASACPRWRIPVGNPSVDGDHGLGRSVRQGREYHSFQKARDALFSLMRLAESKLDRGGTFRKTFTAKVRELFADLVDESVELFTHFFVKQLAKWSVRRAATGPAWAADR